MRVVLVAALALCGAVADVFAGESCPGDLSGDRVVTVDEAVAVVARMLAGPCVALPTPTQTPTSNLPPTETPTNGPSCSTFTGGTGTQACVFDFGTCTTNEEHPTCFGVDCRLRFWSDGENVTVRLDVGDLEVYLFGTPFSDAAAQITGWAFDADAAPFAIQASALLKEGVLEGAILNPPWQFYECPLTPIAKFSAPFSRLGPH